MEPTPDLTAYFARIGHHGAVEPDTTTLASLHLAHVAHVPFENLDIQMGRPITLDLPHLQDKIVRHRRGGYCFEQNTLFLHVLRAVGFDAIPCEARVRRGATGVLARTHMVLVVSVGGTRWLCDVGFGGDGLLQPVRLDGTPGHQFHDLFRVAPEGPLSVLQAKRRTGWEDLYAFLPEARYPADFEMGNWYTSTYPESRFVKTLTVQQATPEARHIVRNLSYTRLRGDQVDTRDLDRGTLVLFLNTLFGLDLPSDARFRALDNHPLSAGEDP